MEFTFATLAVIAGVLGIIGSVVPAIPGPTVGWVGILILYIWGGGEVSTASLIIWGLAMVVVTILDFLVPPIITKKMGGTKYAERGSLYGMLLGMFIPFIGMIIGAFLGAYLAEKVVAKRSSEEALKAAFGSFLGFILGTGLKLIYTVAVLWQILRCVL
jgi:uncharacterized protein YqgC (DUF456 family)